MSEYEPYNTFCPQSNLPVRTFRNHRERYIDTSCNEWSKDISVMESSDHEAAVLNMEIQLEEETEDDVELLNNLDKDILR